MTRDEVDPAYRNALREAFVIIVIYTIALAYTIIYCWLFGYDRDPSAIVLYAGIPDWVVWGVMLPWAASAVVSFWYCFMYMADDDLNPLTPDPEVATRGAVAACDSDEGSVHVS